MAHKANGRRLGSLYKLRLRSDDLLKRRTLMMIAKEACGACPSMLERRAAGECVHNILGARRYLCRVSSVNTGPLSSPATHQAASSRHLLSCMPSLLTTVFCCKQFSRISFLIDATQPKHIKLVRLVAARQDCNPAPSGGPAALPRLTNIKQQQSIRESNNLSFHT